MVDLISKQIYGGYNMIYNINDITHDVNTQDTLNKIILDDYKRLIEAMQERNFFVTQQARGYKRLDTLA
jgi:hypothetical protein